MQQSTSTKRRPKPKAKPRSVQGHPVGLVALVQVLARVPVNGKYDIRTKAAVCRLQRHMGLKETGIIDVKFIRTYLEDHGAVRMGSRGMAVRLVQYIVGVRADGFFGPATLEAVVRLQRACGVKPTGVFGPESMKRMII